MIHAPIRVGKNANFVEQVSSEQQSKSSSKNALMGDLDSNRSVWEKEDRYDEDQRERSVEGFNGTPGSSAGEEVFFIMA